MAHMVAQSSRRYGLTSLLYGRKCARMRRCRLPLCRYSGLTATRSMSTRYDENLQMQQERIAEEEEDVPRAMEAVDERQEEIRRRQHHQISSYDAQSTDMGNIQTIQNERGRKGAGTSVSINFGGGRELCLETGRFGPLADSAVYAKYGDSSVFTTVVSDRELLNQDFMPFQVDYREKTFAAGFIPHTFSRRETMPSDKEVLAARFIDRALRPLFPPGYYYDTQLVSTVMSYDSSGPIDPLSIIGASTALVLSDIPFHGPVAAVRVGLVEGDFVLNPSEEELASSDLNLLFAGTYGRTVMLEVEANEITEDKLFKALKYADEQLKPLLDIQEALRQKIGKEKHYRSLGLPQKSMIDTARELILEDAKAMCRNTSMSKQQRAQAQTRLTQDALGKLRERFVNTGEENGNEFGEIQFQQATQEILHEAIRGTLLESSKSVDKTEYKREFTNGNQGGFQLMLLDGPQRLDGRSSMDIRPLHSEVDVFPKVHGSSLFSRGDTQCMCTVTLGPPTIAQQLRPVAGGTKEKRFMLHYEFPPYCVNEVGRLFSVNRRMIGHGALAEKAIAPMIPSENDFPYVVRATSEVSGSDGSSSMATVCGTTLALLDAGVPIKNPVAGISVGLITPFGFHKPSKEANCSDSRYLERIYDSVGHSSSDETANSNSYLLITDILGLEDHFGDMDFKVAGTDRGITAIQMDIKLPGISLDVIQHAMKLAKIGRLRILRSMSETMSAPRPLLKPSAPRMELIAIPRELRSRVLGPGGMFLRAIENETGAALRFLNEPGREDLQIFAENNEALEKAIDMVKGILLSTNDGNLPEGMNFSLPASESPFGLKVGDTATGEVTEHLDFGAIISINDVDDAGLLHVSQIMPGHVQKLSDVVPVGTKVTAKVTDVDPAGRAKFSVRALIEEGAQLKDLIKLPERHDNKEAKKDTFDQGQPRKSKTDEDETRSHRKPDGGPSKSFESPVAVEQCKPRIVSAEDTANEEEELHLTEFLVKSPKENDPLDIHAAISWERTWFEYLGSDILLFTANRKNGEDERLFSNTVKLNRVAPKPTSGTSSRGRHKRTKSMKRKQKVKTGA